jgi:hypothetical protein
MSSQRPRWWGPILIAVAVAAAAIVAIPSVRQAVLRAPGWALEPVGLADIIVISSEFGAAGALHAADLVQGGIVSRVAVFTDPASRVDLEFSRRGLPDEDASATQIRRLGVLGITDVVQIPTT